MEKPNCIDLVRWISVGHTVHHIFRVGAAFVLGDDSWYISLRASLPLRRPKMHYS